jgi:hypothetical protein
MTEYLRIRKWEKWQSYRSDRGQPPWIKVHRQLLRDPNFVSMTDAERGQLMVLWIIAADREGKIPADPQMLRTLGYMSTDVCIQTFVDNGFIEPDANLTPGRRQHDAPEAEAEAEKKKHMVHAPARTVDAFPVKPRQVSGQYQYPAPFEQAWAVYPDRDGSNPKVGAYSAFRSRVAGGAVPDQLVRAAEHYRQECQTRQREGTEFVMQAATFYGPSEPWREYLEPPKANGKRPDSGEIDVDAEVARHEKLKSDAAAAWRSA